MQENKVSVRKAASIVSTRGSFYESMHRNDYYIPSIKSTIITNKYMLDVAEGRKYAPTYD